MFCKELYSREFQVFPGVSLQISHLCSFYEWSDMTQLDLNIEMRIIDSNVETRRVNQMENHLVRVKISPFDIRVKLRHVTTLVE